MSSSIADCEKTTMNSRPKLAAKIEDPNDSGSLGGKKIQVKVVPGGKPITFELAKDLRRMVYGSFVHPITSEYKKSSITFQSLGSKFPYGLTTQRNGSRGIIMCIQAHLLKQLIFDKYGTYEAIFESSCCTPGASERTEALIAAMAHILWRAGEQKTATVCLVQTDECFQPTGDSYQAYKRDGITEKIHSYEFSQLSALKDFLKQHLEFFQSEQTNGCILFLYSVVLSRKLPKIQEDQGRGTRVQLLEDNEDASITLINLMLTGRAVRYLHNGDIIFNESGEPLVKPRKGIAERSEIGLLYWQKDEENKRRTEVGSMLKTPKNPIWVTLVNGQIAVLFTLNPSLVRDWRSEHKFMLHYYVGLPTQTAETRLTIDTRFEKTGNGRVSLARHEEEKRIPALERCIMTKWYGCSVDWNGVIPFI